MDRTGGQPRAGRVSGICRYPVKSLAGYEGDTPVIDFPDLPDFVEDAWVVRRIAVGVPCGRTSPRRCRAA